MEGDGWVKEGRAEDQEDQGTLKQLGGVPPTSFIPPWSSWPSFWLSPMLPDNPSSHLILQPVQDGENCHLALPRTLPTRCHTTLSLSLGNIVGILPWTTSIYLPTSSAADAAARLLNLRSGCCC